MFKAFSCLMLMMGMVSLFYLISKPMFVSLGFANQCFLLHPSIHLLCIHNKTEHTCNASAIQRECTKRAEMILFGHNLSRSNHQKETWIHTPNHSTTMLMRESRWEWKGMGRRPNLEEDGSFVDGDRGSGGAEERRSRRPWKTGGGER